MPSGYKSSMLFSLVLLLILSAYIVISTELYSWRLNDKNFVQTQSDYRFPFVANENPTSFRYRSMLNATKTKWLNQKLSKVNANELEYIFFEHIRKCGGTTMRDFLNNQVVVQDKLTPSQKLLLDGARTDNRITNIPGIVIHSERRAFAFSCLNTELAARTLFVTVIRNPIERWQSEFVYQGIYAKFINNLVKTGNFLSLLNTLDNVDFQSLEELKQTSYGRILLDDTVTNKDKLDKLTENSQLLFLKAKTWINLAPDDPIWEKRQVIGGYLPNVQTRFLSGSCECLSLRDDTAIYHAFHKTGLDFHRKITGCPEGKRVFNKMNVSDLKIALNVVDKFDAAVPFELLHDPNLIESVLNNAANSKHLSYRFILPTDITRKKSSHAPNKRKVNILQFPEILDRLKRENALDLSLHNYVKEKFGLS